MPSFVVRPHTAYPLFAEKKPEVYNAGRAQVVLAANAREAAHRAVDETLRSYEASGSVGSTGTFRYAVIGSDTYGATVEIVDVEIETASVRVKDVQTA